MSGEPNCEARRGPLDAGPVRVVSLDGHGTESISSKSTSSQRRSKRLHRRHKWSSLDIIDRPSASGRRRAANMKALNSTQAIRQRLAGEAASRDDATRCSPPTLSRPRLSRRLRWWRGADLSLVILIALTLSALTGQLGSAEQQFEATSTQQVAEGPTSAKDVDNGRPRKNPVERNTPKHEVGSTEALAGIGKRSAAAALSSAELPAEFRSVNLDQSDQQPREQSRLAKLCQQTSSVLASVLPAPFGGHKRSILCQFFGQVHVGGTAQGNTSKRTIPTAFANQPPNSNLIGASPQETESVAILQQHHQPPVALVAAGKHPIELVLEHQRRVAAQMALASKMSVINQFQSRPNAPLEQRPAASRHNSGLALDIAAVTRQRPPVVKFSSPLMTSPSTGQPGAWRIFNVTALHASGSSQQESAPSSSSTTTTVQTLASTGTSSTTPTPKTKASSMTSEIAANQTADTLELAVAESRQAPESAGEIDSAGVRTIDVVSQNAPLPPSAAVGQQSTAKPSVSTKQAGTTSTTKSDIVQKREELVIASINNLTRIAFGNHLRDTVKVINNLIDQQAEFFSNGGKAHAPKRQEAAADPMQVSESVAKGRMASLMAIPLYKAEKSKSSGQNLRKIASSTVGKGNRLSSVDRPRGNSTESLRTFKSRASAAVSKTAAPPVRATTTQRRNQAKVGRGTTNSSGKSRPAAMTTAANLELRRLTTIGRSLLLKGLENEAQTSPRPRAPKREFQSSKSLDDLLPDQSIADLRRDSKGAQSSGWMPTSNQPAGRPATDDKSSGLAMRKLRDEFARPSQSRPTSAPNSDVHSGATATQFPWLLLDQNAALDSDPLIGSSSVSVTSSASSQELSTSAAAKKWTTRRVSSPKLLSTTRSTDRLDQKLDSLTTLKMSLKRARGAQGSRGTKTATDWQVVSSTPLPFSGGISGGQSRWIPSTMFTTTRQTTTTSSTERPQPTGSTPTSVSVRPSPNSEANSLTTRKAELEARDDRLAAQNELSEARAAESISKFTTHLSESNEPLETTRRHLQMPKIADTGDFFSAETIASWPEKYQTMISRAMEPETQAMGQTSKMAPMQTTKALETTRRNGEPYEEMRTSSSDAILTTLARHRMNQTNPTEFSIRPLVSLGNTPGITILPANHKLDSLSSSSQMDGSPSTQPMKQTTMAAMDSIGTESPSAASPLKSDSSPVPPYTLVEHLLASTPSASDNQTTRMLASGAEYLTLTSLTPFGSGATNFSAPELLKAPYQNSFKLLPSDLQLSEPTLVLDRGQNRPHVSRKLYELLVPSTRNFVGAQNPLNMQRFNWSALKYLTQNLLTSGRFSLTNSSLANSTGVSPEANDFQLKDSNNEYGGNRTILSGADNYLNTTHYAPTNYYEMNSNDSSLVESWLRQEELADQSNTNTSRSLFERASNLLSEMKQVEQKRAAAILAAFRYQVPGPLVKPWDVASDTQASSGRAAFAPSPSSISRFFIDRFDRPEGKQLSTGQLLSSLKSTLFKQRLVAREELMARLNRREMEGASESDNLNWRLDESVDGVELPHNQNMAKQKSNSDINVVLSH